MNKHEGGKKMSEKSKNNPWQVHLKQVRLENPGKKSSEIFRLAKESYQKINRL